MVHARRAAVRGHLLERRQQIPFGKDLVNQPKPFSSFHSLFQSRQHAIGPDARFDPSPSREDLSGLLSLRHCRRLVFRWLGHSSSIFLGPFAPPALPGFLATMDPLTPGRPALRILIRDNEHRPGSVQVSLFHVSNLPTVPPPTTCCRLRDLVWFCPGAYRAVCRPHPFRGTRASFGLRHYLAGSPRQPAESSSSSCGPAVHLQLLSTPSREDAVTFGYKVQTQLRQGLSPC